MSMTGVSAAEAEIGIVGAILMAPSILPRIADDLALVPEHFYTPRVRALYEALLALGDRREGFDRVTVLAELERRNVSDPLALIDGAVACSAPAGLIRDYVRLVIDTARYRSLHLASQLLARGAAERNDELLTQALALIQQNDPAARNRQSYNPLDLAHALAGWFERTEDDAMPLPFWRLTQAMDGGIRPGEVMLLAGYTGQGKSIFADQILDQAAKHDKRVHLYMTEMTAIQRGLRMLARRTNIGFRKLRRGRLSEAELKVVLEELNRLPYGVTITSDWTVEETCRHIRRARWDLCVVDLLHGFGYSDEADLRTASGLIAATARSSYGEGFPGTAIVAIAHLNDGQMKDRVTPSRPKPGMHSIKGSTALKQDADYVCFVWQKDDDRGIPTGEGEVWLAKARQGETATVSVRLNAGRMRFEEIAE